jgi:hypothetical protein
MRIHLEMLMAYSLVLDGGLGHPPFGVTKEVRILREWPLTCSVVGLLRLAHS